MMKTAALIFASLLLAVLASAETENTPPGTTAKAPDSTTGAAKSAPHVVAKAVPLPKDVKKLIVEDTIVGAGKLASKSKTIKVQYTGWLYDPSQPMGRGRQFDTSVGKEPFSFSLGAGKVIKGWDDGFENMRVGGKRKIIIPSSLGYGAHGAGPDIPPNSPLMFEVELLDVM
jgi:FKBP-type peptidyl-prolyl cis-trans isomerase FkpA